ncbi:MBOAT family protein [Alkalinema sp. FACHB-956]|uniref:MBOAT family O-acyltransferase n=1 Tax=Alkalinema sp. FACHB-956 TaxID=2692768 RepID=UPI001685C1B4|nr:MBOAT family protein [Alkalinema sp. FACHB-956]MBD2326251.1 MBOAT family protein [Alkalinema sp. FACHB-956]
MNFLSLTYAVFLLGVVGVYWTLPKPQLRIWVLLLASLMFYGTLYVENSSQVVNQAQYIPLLLVMTWITFQLGRAIGSPPDWRIEDWQFAQQDWNRRRIKLLVLGIGLNLFLLLSFKSVVLLLASTIAQLFKVDLAFTESAWKNLSLLTPIGLSYFTFECISYLVDVYRGAPASRNFARFSAYKLFFPKLTSGPITRYPQFVTQLQSLTFPNADQISEGLWLIACGAVKKGLIADRLGTYVNLSFDNLTRAGSGDIWLTTIAYGFQLYLDFSGYVDVARGSAMLLGFNLPQNFNFPYFSTSIASFWRRWHMSLGDWLRNYLYFPLGGSRKGLLRTCFNLLLVMVLCGLWHGATWGFIVWGTVHGLALVGHRLVDGFSKRHEWMGQFWQSLPGITIAWLATQLVVFLSWLLFRLPNLKDAIYALQNLVGKAADPQFAIKIYQETLGISPQQIWACLGVLTMGMGISYLFHQGLKLQLNWYLKLLLVPLCLYAVFLFSPQGAAKYIYFDF